MSMTRFSRAAAGLLMLIALVPSARAQRGRSLNFTRNPCEDRGVTPGEMGQLNDALSQLHVEPGADQNLENKLVCLIRLKPMVADVARRCDQLTGTRAALYSDYKNTRAYGVSADVADAVTALDEALLKSLVGISADPGLDAEDQKMLDALPAALRARYRTQAAALKNEAERNAARERAEAARPRPAAGARPAVPVPVAVPAASRECLDLLQQYAEYHCTTAPEAPCNSTRNALTQNNCKIPGGRH